MSAPPATTVACPGCGSVLAPAPDDGPAHPGASAPCARLFEVTLRGLREEAPAAPSVAAVVQLADDAYDAQHPVAADPQRLADLDVIDLPVLVEAWAGTVAA